LGNETLSPDNVCAISKDERYNFLKSCYEEGNHFYPMLKKYYTRSDNAMNLRSPVLRAVLSVEVRISDSQSMVPFITHGIGGLASQSWLRGSLGSYDQSDKAR
jgi:hypothetical protein